MSERPAHRITLMEFALGGKRLYATQCSCGWESRHYDNSAGADHEAARHLAAVRWHPFTDTRPAD